MTKINVIRGLEESKQYGKISKLTFPNGSSVYISKKGWTAKLPGMKKNVTFRWGEIQACFDESIKQGYVKGVDEA